jgi:hypothetical protein
MNGTSNIQSQFLTLMYIWSNYKFQSFKPIDHQNPSIITKMNQGSFYVNMQKTKENKHKWDFITCFPQEPRRRRSTSRSSFTQSNSWDTTLNNTQNFKMNGDISVSLLGDSFRHTISLYAEEEYRIVQQLHGNLATNCKTIKAYLEVVDECTMKVYERQCFYVECDKENCCKWIVDTKLKGLKIKVVITYVVDWIGDLEFFILQKESPIYDVIQVPAFNNLLSKNDENVLFDCKDTLYFDDIQ